MGGRPQHTTGQEVRRHHGGRRRAPGAAGVPAAVLVLLLAGCSLVGAEEAAPDGDGEGPDSASVPDVEVAVSEVQLPGEYDDEGQRTSSWHLLPGDGDVPALAVAISQVMGEDEQPVVAMWHAATGELFGAHTNLDAAGQDVQEVSLGGDGSLAVVGGYRAPGNTHTAFLLTSTDRHSWEEVDLGEHSALELTAVGGSQDLAVAVDSSAEEHAQVLVIDDGDLDLITLAPDDGARQAVVRHVFVHADRVILSGHESAPGRADTAAIWVSEDRGRTFTRTEVDEEGSVAGVTRAGRRYFATGNERQGQWLRPRIWTSGSGQDWRRFTLDFYQRDLGWSDYEEDQGLSVPLVGHGGFFAALWSQGEPRVKVVFHSREEGWSGIGVTGVLSDLGVSGLVAADGPDYRTLLISPEVVRETWWGEEVRDVDIAVFVPGARLQHLIAMDEGTLVSTTRPAYDEPDDGGFRRFQQRASYALDSSDDWLPEGLGEHGARSSFAQDGVRMIVGSGGAQWDRIPLWRQAGTGAAWTRHWIEIDEVRDETTAEESGVIEAIFPSRLIATAGEWVLTGESGAEVSREGRYATIWTSPDGRDWDLDEVLPGPQGTSSVIEDVCTWEDGLIAVGGYGRVDGGDGLALWHGADGAWDRIEVDEDWHGELSYCRVEEDTVEVGADGHWWTTTDLATFTAGQEEESDDDEAWTSATVRFDDGWAYATGSAEGADLMVSVEAGQWEAVPLDLAEDLTDGVAAVREDGALLIAERDTGRAWRIDRVADLLTHRSAS